MMGPRWKVYHGDGVAIAEFKPTQQPYISLKVGDELRIIEEYDGKWFRGTNVSTKELGVFPASFAHLKLEEEPVKRELSETVKEWLTLLRQSFCDRRRADYAKLRTLVEILFNFNRKLNMSSTPDAQKAEIRSAVVSKIEEGRRLLGEDMIVRLGTGEAANETNTALLQLYQLHEKSFSSSKKINGILPRSNTSRTLPTKSGGRTDSDAPSMPPMKQLIINMKSFVCPVGEDTELKFFLYQKSKDQIMSDQFQVVLTSKGLPMDPKLLNNLMTVFRDLPPMVSLADLFLVCRVFRRGGLTAAKQTGGVPAKSKKDERPPDFRRPVGVAAMNISQAGIKRGKEVENVMPIYMSKDENQFWNMLDLITSDSREIEKVPKSTGIIVGFNMLLGSFQETILKDPVLSRMPVTLPLEINLDDPLNFTRNDFYITLKEAELTKSRAVEVEVYVRDGSGKTIDKACISGMTHNPFPQNFFRSYVLNPTQTLKWEETFLIRIAPQFYNTGLHLFIALKACDKTGKDDGFGYGKIDLIAPDGTVIRDMVHNVQLIKPGKGVNIHTEPTWYLKEKPSDSSKAKVLLKKEFIKVGSKLISNQFTQNPYLYTLFHWQQTPPQKLLDAVSKMTFAPQDEILKFLKYIFDASFAILDAKVPGAGPAVFTALVFVIDVLVDDRRGANFRSVLDEYLTKYFRSVTTLEHFVIALVQYFSQYETKKSAELINTLKALEYIVKFIAQSAMYWAMAGGDVTPYKQQMFVFFQHINALLKNNKPQFVGAQTACVKKLSPVLPQLLRLFSAYELATVAVDFINSIPYNEQTKNLNLEKLALFQTLIESPLLQDVDAGRLLLSHMVGHIAQYLQSKVDEEYTLVVDLMLSLVDQLQKTAQIAPDYIAYVVPILPTLIALVEKTQPVTEDNGFDPQKSKMAMVLLGMFYLMQPADFMNFFATIQTIEDQRAFLQTTFSMFSRIFARKIPTFPDNWFVMLMFQFSVALKVTIVMASFMQERLGIIDKEVDLWCSFFKLLLEFVNSKILYLETFTDTKKKMVIDNYGDMRTDVCQILSVMWQALDAWQYQFRDQLLLDFLRLSTVPQAILGTTGADLFITLIEREIQQTGGVAKAAEMTITCFENLYPDILSNVKGTGLTTDEEREYIKNFFTNIFGEKLSALGQQAATINNDVPAFMDMLHEVRSVPEEPSFEDDRTAAILRLCEWAKKSNRLDLFKRNVNDLIRAHTASGNFAEAGNLCLYLASIYAWNATLPEEEFAEFPRQSQHERKVAIYKQAISLLDKGKLWEKCAKLCAELRRDGNAFSELESQLDTNIKTTDRFFSEYFRVGYFGRGFPAGVRNKEFIYRGLELERLSDFSQRIQAKFPSAKMLTYTDPPTDEVLNSDTQNLQIFSVKSSSLEEKEGKPSPRINDSMHPNSQKYFNVNDVGVFLYSKPFRKNKQKGEQQHEEFADLWYRNYYYVLADPLPALNRRSDITRIDITETHPVDNAINAMKDKNREITEMTTRYEGGNAGNLAPFTMILKGVIDAAVSGGTVLYTKAFFNDDWLSRNRDRVAAAEVLNQALVTQVVVLDKGLKLHASLCPQEMAALQQDLDARLVKVKIDLKASLGPLGDLFRRYGGSGNFSLGGLDLSNLEAQAASIAPAAGGPAAGAPQSTPIAIPGMAKLPGMPGMGSPGSPMPKFPQMPPVATPPSSPVPTSAGVGGYGGLPGMANLGSPLQRRISVTNVLASSPGAGAMTGSPPTGSPQFPQMPHGGPLGVQTAPAGSPAGAHHARPASFGVNGPPPNVMPKFPGPPGSSSPGPANPKFPGPPGGFNNQPNMPPMTPGTPPPTNPTGPPNSNYASLPAQGSPAMPITPKFPGPPGSNGLGAATAPPKLGSTAPFPGSPGGNGAFLGGNSGFPGGSTPPPRSDSGPQSNYGTLPPASSQPKFPGPPNGGNMGVATAPPKLGAPLSGPLGAGNSPGGPPNSNYGALPAQGNPKFPGPPGGPGNMGVSTAPPKLGSTGLPGPPGGPGNFPQATTPPPTHEYNRPSGGPPNSNYGALPPASNQPKFPNTVGNMGHVTAPPKLGTPFPGPPAGNNPSGPPNSNYGGLPPPANPSIPKLPPSVSGGPPNSNYGGLPPATASMPKLPGPPNTGLQTAPPKLGFPGPPSNPGTPPPNTGMPKFSGTSGGPPNSNYGSLPPSSNQPKFPGPLNGGNMTPPPTGASGGPPPRPATGYNGAPVPHLPNNPPMLPNGAVAGPGGPPQSNYGALPPGGSFGNMTAPGGPGGPPRLGSTASGGFNNMTAPGGMAPPGQPKFPGSPSMPGSPQPGGPPNSNYGGLPPPAGGYKMPPPPAF